MFVFCQCLGPDDDVVQIDVADMANEVSNGHCYVPLIGCRGISEAHGHYNPFPQAKWGQCSSVFDVVGVY